MDAQLGKYTKNQWIVYFWYMSCMVCELYLNKTIIKKKKKEPNN